MGADAAFEARLDALFEQALSLPEAERASFVARACDGEAGLRARLECRLADAASTAGFLERSPWRTAPPSGLLTGAGDPSADAGSAGEGSAGARAAGAGSAGGELNADVAASVHAGARVGPYRLVRRLGAGGMGEVWLAERADGAFEQAVALKLMLAGARASLDRFRAERQILAELDHPGIARLYDGGIVADGRPWMAMEYVDGRDLLAWCDERNAGLEQRLALFLQVCDAVTYAHSRLVVHRDVKPGNVLVTRDGHAKLLDFGIAKLLDVDAAPDATRTAHVSVAYAAPEQLRGGTVTTATDVFSLGVTLYQLLSGRLPWAGAGAVLGDALPRLLGDEPPPASRVTDGRIPARALRGDLDAILAKALRTAPDARYADARALADDVRRVLAREPVQARTGARAYVARRFLRRHWLPVAAIVAAFVALGAGLAGTVWQAKRAEREQKRAAATRDFLLGVFEASDPRIASERPRGEITARELLDASVARIDTEFADDPETQIELLGVTADVYRELGETERYDHLHRRHYELARRTWGDRHPVVIGDRLDDASWELTQGRADSALRMLDAVDATIREAGLDESAVRAHWWLLRGQSLLRDGTRSKEIEDALRRSIALYDRTAPRDRDRVTALADLGAHFSNRMDFERGRRYTEQAIDAALQLPRRNDAELATMYGNLGLASFNVGDFAAADRAYAKSNAAILATYGPRHPNHWYHSAQRARARHLAGDRDGAAALFREVFEYVPATEDYDTALVRELHGACLAAEGRANEGIPELEAAVRLYRGNAAGAAYDFDLPRALLALGDAYDRAGRTADARRTLTEALERRLKMGSADSQPLLAVRERLGRILLSQGEIDAAAAQFDEVIARDGGRRLAHTALALAGAARVALARNDVAAADAASGRALDAFDHVRGFRDVRMQPYLWLVRAEFLRRAADRAGARALAQRALEASRRYDAPGAASIAAAETALRALDRG